MWYISWIDKPARQSQDSIKILEEILGLLRIIEEYASKINRITELATLETEELLIAPAPAVYNETEHTVMIKSVVPDPG